MGKPKNCQIQCIEVVHFTDKEDESLNATPAKENRPNRCSKQEKPQKKKTERKTN